MGAYLNPPIDKAIWLELHGEPLPTPPTKVHTGEKLAVCLVNNGPFTAAGIIFDEEHSNLSKYLKR